jgi:ParB family chromosome partitioning protein
MQKSDNPRRALGKGIGALLPTRSPAPPPQPLPALPPEHEERSLEIDPNLIDPNPLQPRRIFQQERLAELAQSIQSNGIIQPLVVTKKGDRYQLVAGERRWRAAKLAGVATVPVIVRDIPDGRLLEITLVENIQREDLSAIETAIAFARMTAELHLNPEQIGIRTGKDRTTIINFMRLLQLPQDVQDMVSEGKLSAGHARCLLKLPTHVIVREVAQKVVELGWSVRQTERICNKMVDAPTAKRVVEERIDPNLKAAIQEMERRLGTRIHVTEGARGKGKLEIEYYSSDDLTRIYDIIMGES